MKGLQQFVCRILDGEKKVRGTGFFIHPNGYIATCYHVVHACKEKVGIGIFGESKPIECEIVIEDEDYDIAVLNIGRKDCQYLPLESEWNLGDKVFSHGFSIKHLSTFPDEGFPVESILSGMTTPKNRKTEVIVLEKTEVDHGLSGAPAFNERTGNVIGLLTMKYEDGRKALVVPIDRLFEKWPELQKYHESIQNTKSWDNNINGDLLYKKFKDASTSLFNYIRVRDFQNLVNDRTRNFVGREFIFKAIDNLLKKPDFSSGYIVISGEPGIGKTALIAQLVKNKGYIHHFNIAPQGIRSTRDFLGNICAQLIARYTLNYLTLPAEALQDSGFLSELLVQAAALEKNLPMVILIDALDEAEDTNLPSNANRLYLPLTLPEGVFFVITSREEHDYRLSVDRREDIYLQDNDPQNLDDVRQYIYNFINEYTDQMIPKLKEWQVEENEFVNIITDKSEGNFMYLVHVLRDIRDGKLTAANIDNIHKLPRGLKDYYQRHWRSMKSQDEDRFNKYYQPVVCILATVRGPVSIEQVAEWTKLDTFSISQVIQTWREFLNEVEDEKGNLLYRIYHASFQDFLNEEVGLKRYHEIIGLNALSKIPSWFNG
jgi:S1-C subfamily serine protease